MKADNTSSGFSLIEIMIAVTVIGILALLWVPTYRLTIHKAEATASANDLRVFTEAVEFYSTSEGSYPASMTYTSMPDDIEDYVPFVWKNGEHNWFYVNSSAYTYLYLYNLGFTAEQSVRVDSILDDGNIATGNIRVANSGSGLVYLFRYEPPNAPNPSAPRGGTRQGRGGDGSDIVRISGRVR